MSPGASRPQNPDARTNRCEVIMANSPASNCSERDNRRTVALKLTRGVQSGRLLSSPRYREWEKETTGATPPRPSYLCAGPLALLQRASVIATKLVGDAAHEGVDLNVDRLVEEDRAGRRRGRR